MTPLQVPLRFLRIFKNPVWSGRRLAAVPGFRLPTGTGPETPPVTSIGETWEVVDREGDNSVVSGGDFEGWTLRRLVQEAGDDLLGSTRATADGRFPLLVKLIDARDRLYLAAVL